MISHSQIEQISQFAIQKSIELVYLFGSQATDKTTPLSDYDFAVLFDEDLNDRERFDERLATISFLTGILRTDKVDVVDLKKAPPALRFESFAPRKEIYVKSNQKRVEFEQKAMNDYFDQIYYLKRHTSQSLATIAREGLI